MVCRAAIDAFSNACSKPGRHAAGIARHLNLPNRRARSASSTEEIAPLPEQVPCRWVTLRLLSAGHIRLAQDGQRLRALPAWTTGYRRSTVRLAGGDHRCIVACITPGWSSRAPARPRRELPLGIWLDLHGFTQQRRGMGRRDAGRRCAGKAWVNTTHCAAAYVSSCCWSTSPALTATVCAMT